jgi:hypothetical protein
LPSLSASRIAVVGLGWQIVWCTRRSRDRDARDFAPLAQPLISAHLGRILSLLTYRDIR